LKKLSIVLCILLCVTFFSSPIAAETYSFDVANVLTADHTHSQVLEYFAERLEELSDGQVTVNVFLDGVLGDEREVMEQVQLGNIDLTRTSHAVLTSYVEELETLGLPFIFDDVPHMYQEIEGAYGQHLEDLLEEAGFIVLGWFDYGARSVIATRPVRHPDDLSGLRIRVEEDRMKVEMFEQLGASAVQLPWPDQYSALDSGVIDAAENAPDTIYDARLHEVAEYYSLTEHNIQPTLLYMSSRVFNDLPENIQNKIIEAGRDSVEWIKENQPLAIEEGLTLLEEEGTTIIEDVDRDAFFDKSAPMLDKYYEKYPDLLDLLEAF